MAGKCEVYPSGLGVPVGPRVGGSATTGSLGTSRSVRWEQPRSAELWPGSCAHSGLQSLTPHPAEPDGARTATWGV
jgi:hypothetical protein